MHSSNLQSQEPDRKTATSAQASLGLVTLLEERKVGSALGKMDRALESDTILTPSPVSYRNHLDGNDRKERSL